MSNYESLSYNELRSLAKERGVKASGKAADIIKRLVKADKKDGGAPAVAVEEVSAPEESNRIDSCPSCKRTDCCYMRIAVQ